MGRGNQILIYTTHDSQAIRDEELRSILTESGFEMVTDSRSAIGKISESRYGLIIFSEISNMFEITRLCSHISNSVNQRTPLIITESINGLFNTSFAEENPGLTNKSGILQFKRKAEKLEDPDLIETIITTAATLGHEINNPLMSISANIEILLARFDYLPDEVIDKLNTVSNAALRIQEVLINLTELEMLKYRQTPSGRMIDFERGDSDRKSRLRKGVLTWNE